MRTVWRVAPPSRDEKRFGKHPTQKPVALIARCIRASTRPGEWCSTRSRGRAARESRRCGKAAGSSESNRSLSTSRWRGAASKMPRSLTPPRSFPSRRGAGQRPPTNRARAGTSAPIAPTSKATGKQWTTSWRRPPRGGHLSDPAPAPRI